MRPSLLRLLAFIALAACGDAAGLPPYTAPVAITDAQLVDDVRNYLALVEEGGTSGVVALRVGDTERVFGLGSADRENARAFGPDTLVPLGSLTKGMLGLLVARLAEEGSVDVDAPLGPALEGVLAVPADKADLTLHELLTHTSGLPGSLGADDERLARDAFWERAMAAPLRERGTFRYGNVGYSVAAAALEAMTGEPHERSLARALDGTGITGFRYDAPSGAQLAVGYRGGRRWGTLLEQPRLEDGPGWNLRGNGGLLASMADVLAWRRWVLAQAPGVRSRALAQHVEYGGGSFYGYGFDVRDSPRGTRFIDHDGGNGIFFARLTWWTDEDVLLVTATNVAEQDGNVLHVTLAEAIIARLNRR
ncbi:MAG: serine hydrolase domain-containing protein [Myxococcota bacterium]